MVALILFPLVGFAAASLLRIPLPRTLAARVALALLLGAGVHGTLLFAGVPWFVPPLLSLVVVIVSMSSRASSEGPGRAGRQVHASRPAHPGPSTTLGMTRGNVLASALQTIPLVVLLASAAVLPIRDYDGRVTWLPKARAIAREGSTTGPFFQGQRGLNLHNRYPLLIPLDAATLMRAADDTSNEAARWLYVLIAVAMFVVARAMFPSPWIAAALPWLGIVAHVEGGALAAYNDFAMAAFFGIAVLYLLEDEPFAAGVFAAFAVMTKNEGLALAIAVVGAAVVARRFRWTMLVPIAIAEGIVVAWRMRVPAAYDEQYEVLLRFLPQKLERVPAALGAIGKHALQFSEWGVFWIAVAVAAVVAWRRAAVPLVAMLLALAAYTVALAVTSWRIEDLAPVAVNRLLLHLLLPAAYVLSVALGSRKTEPAAGVTPGP